MHLFSCLFNPLAIIRGRGFFMRLIFMRSIDPAFYKSQAWKNTQRDYMKLANGICERCKAKGIIKPAYFVHHKTHLTADNVKIAAIAYGFNNLEALCFDCHNAEHFNNNNKRWRIEDGRLLIIDTPPI